jgi:hypothetical protein
MHPGVPFNQVTPSTTETPDTNIPDINSVLGFSITNALTSEGKYADELKKIKALWDSKQYTAASNLYYASKYYQDMGNTQAARYTLALNQPEVYKKELDKYMLSQKQRLSGLGVKIDSKELDTYLKAAYDGNLDNNQLDVVISKASDFGMSFGGTTLSAIQTAKSYARSMGVSLDDGTLNNYGRGLFAGSTTSADIEEAIRQQASSAYPAYRDLINKGVTMDAISSSYKQSMASILEINPNTIDYNDMTLRKALQYNGFEKGNNAGGPTQMPLWQFENQLREDPRWQYTNNARDSAYTSVNQVLTDFGLK